MSVKFDDSVKKQVYLKACLKGDRLFTQVKIMSNCKVVIKNSNLQDKNQNQKILIQKRLLLHILSCFMKRVVVRISPANK